MTGFKEGASPSPFDDEEEDRDEEPAGLTDDELSVDFDESNDDESSNEEPSLDSAELTRLPWIYRRESAVSDRDKTKQLHLQRETAQQESQFRDEIERRIDDTIQLADLREAAYLVAMKHPDEVANQLREWGYDYD